MRSFLKFMSGLVKVVLCMIGLLVVVLALFLNACSRRVPDALARRIEDALCTDAICVRFDTAAFNLFEGITFNRMRLYARGMLGQPLVEVDSLHVGLTLRFGSSIPECIDSLSLRGLDFAEFPDFDRLGGLLADTAEDAGDDPGSSAYSWMMRPIDLDIRDFNFLGTRIETVTSRVTLRGRIFHFDDFRLHWAGENWPEHAIGELTHNIDEGSFRFSLDGYATPKPLYPIFHAIGANGVVRFCEDFSNFHSPLETKFELLQRDMASPTEIKVSLDGGGFDYLGMPLAHARAVVTYSEGGIRNQVKVKSLFAEHGTGVVSGDMELDPDCECLSMNLKSTVAVPVVARVISDFNAELASNVVAAISFDAPPTITASGKVSLDGSETVDLRGHITSVHPFTVIDVPVESADSDYALTEKYCDFPNMSASAFGGMVTGLVHLAEIPGTTNQEWMVHGVGEGTGLKFGDFCRDLFAYTNSFGGVLNGTFDLSAPLERGAFPTGFGHARVHDGIIARIPLFAGFTDYLAENIPGIDTVVTQSDLSGDFVCTNRQFRTENLLVEGGFFSMRASGRYRDIDHSLDFVAKVRLLREKTLAGKLIRIVTFPFNKFLEFRVFGTAEEPRWAYIGILDRVIDIFRGEDEEADE